MTRLKGGKKKRRRVRDSEDEDGSGSESESEGEDEEGGDVGRKEDGLEMFEGNREECKLVLVVRTDLGMGKGVYWYHFFCSFLFLFSLAFVLSSPLRSAPFQSLLPFF